MRKTIVLCLIVSASFVASAGELVIAERGKPAEYAVVIAEKASPSEKWAAGDFCKYVGKLTGVKLAVRTDAEALPERAVVMGWTKYTGELLGKDKDATLADLDECGFILKAVGKRLVAAAGPVSGTVYASDELLERFGRVRWLTPWFERVPEAARFAVPDDLDFADKPKLPVRATYVAQFTYYPEFCAHRRINGTSCGAAHGETALKFSRVFGGCHTFNAFFPEAQYFKTQPELYGLVGGKRQPVQPCLTNPDVLGMVVQRIFQQMEKEKDARIFGVSQNDDNGWCECERCKAVYAEEGAKSGTLVRFVNEVARRVRAKRPDVYIQTLAYQYTEKPPKTKPIPGVIVTYCGTQIGNAQPISDSVFPASKIFAKNFREWATGGAQMDTWTYDFNADWYFWPFPNLLSAQKNFQFYAENGGRRMFQQAGRLLGDSKQLQLYCYSKWMWNPYLEFWPTVDEFIDGYYGMKAAPIVKEYYRYVYDHHSKRNFARYPMRFNEQPDPAIFGPDFLARADNFWKRIFAATEGEDESVRFNTLSEGVGIAFMHLKLFVDSYPLIALRNPTENAEFRAAAEMARRLTKVYDECERRGLVTLNIATRDRWRFFGDCPLLMPDFEHVMAALEKDEIPSPSYERIMARNVAIRPFKILNNQAENFHARDPYLPWYQLGSLIIKGSAVSAAVESNLDRILADDGQELVLRARMRLEGARGGTALKVEVVDGKTGETVATNALKTETFGEGYHWQDIVRFKWRKGLKVRLGGAPRAKGERSPHERLHLESWSVYDPNVSQKPYFEVLSDYDTMIVTNVAVVSGGKQTVVSRPGARWGEITFVRDGQPVVLENAYAQRLDAEEWRWVKSMKGVCHLGRTNNKCGRFIELAQFNVKRGAKEIWNDLKIAIPLNGEGKKLVRLVVDEVEGGKVSDVRFDGEYLRFNEIDWGKISNRWLSVRFHFEVK